MKKLLSLVLAVVVALSLATFFACNNAPEQQPEQPESEVVAENGLTYTYSSYAGKKGYFVKVGSCTDVNITVKASVNGTPVIAVADNGFKEVTTLATITLPEGLLKIGASAFESTGETLTSITIPSSVTEIGANAFYASYVATVNFSANAQLKIIGDNAFCGSSLTAITLPASLTNVGYGAFKDCEDLTSVTFASATNWGFNYAGNTLPPLPIQQSLAVPSVNATLLTTVDTTWTAQNKEAIPTGYAGFTLEKISQN